MDSRNRTPQPTLTTSAVMEHGEEVSAEVDEPPEQLEWSPSQLNFPHLKLTPSYLRRESLLTQQILSETEHSDDGHPPPPRTMSTQSTWSNPSTTSMAELTSDDGRSVASPAISPPLSPTHRNTQAVSGKPLEPKVKIVGEDHVGLNGDSRTTSEKSVEANLGRKRCISFACKSKQEAKPVDKPAAEVQKPEPVSPPKRKCMLKFVCPTRSGSDSKPEEKNPTKRRISPPPPHRRPSLNGKHRGSDATVTHVSPKAVRKSSTPGNATPKGNTSETGPQPRRYSGGSSDEDGGDSTRFHEFGASDDEPDQWVQESTCHRKRLTVNDTLQKENVIRKTCEEAEEEVLEEEEEDEEEELDEELAAVAELDEADNGMEDDYESDEGFHSDDEDGFASSDSEGDDDSDYEWWRPGNVSTAATSVEQLDRLAIVNSHQAVPSSSLGSASSGHMSRQTSKVSFKKLRSRTNATAAVPIHRPGSPDLPDSTDFVCGTLDEDRPLEQAYINKRKLQDAANHKARPQDIDPTFPTSDPEMDEEDDDDLDDGSASEADDLMHGELEELHGTVKKASPIRARGRSNSHRSPPPPTTRIHTPPPAKRTAPRSPPPPTMRARSPAPRKLFGRSPSRAKSPMPVKRMTSPPNSPTNASAQFASAPHGLAGRPALTHTASLPRGGPIALSKLATIASDQEDSDTGAATEIPKRGAIDIVKGVQWKRQRRKEKLYQKACAKAAAKDRNHKVKPGKGAERMREVGLQLQQYRGKAGHILSL